MDDIQALKMKKLVKAINELGISTKSGREAIVDAIHAIAYEARKIDSQTKANQRNLDKINKKLT